MKIERLYSRAPPFRRLISTEESLGDEEIQRSSPTVDQPPTQPPTQQTVKALMSALAITYPTVAKGKENPYTKPEIGMYYSCNEPEHKSIECPKRRQVNMTDYKDEDEVQIETEPEDKLYRRRWRSQVVLVVSLYVYRRREETDSIEVL